MLRSKYAYQVLTGLLCLIPQLIFGQADPGIATPTPTQYKWHEQERIMFVCLDPCTWQGREYDNHSTPLEQINPGKLDTDQWCETAQLWGANEILFVAKHTGGFCWWQTETTDYGIRNTPYKNGKGDVLKELSESCQKYGLNLGIYVYPGDETWGAGIGSGGKTADPSKQEDYNKVFRKQLEETLANYGNVLEVWFDGSCIIDVSDIIEKYAKNAVIFQGPHATLRWPGTESGKLFYPAWNTVKNDDFKTGVSTQVHGDPDGDVWAPLETNTTLYNHFWFWSEEGAKKRKSLDELMDCYYKSVGYGSVFLLNSTPDTSGLIPEEDRMLYKALGDEIDRRFNSPLLMVENVKGNELILDLRSSQTINHLVIREDYRFGHRIREYIVEGYSGNSWKELSRGQSVGRMKIDYFDEIEVSKIRLTVLKNVGEPLFRSFSTYFVDGFDAPQNIAVSPWSEWQQIVNFQTPNNDLIEVDLSDKIKIPGQFAVKLLSNDPDADLVIEEVKLIYDDREVLKEFVSIKGDEIHINRTAQVIDESKIALQIYLKANDHGPVKVQFKPLLIY